ASANSRAIITRDLKPSNIMAGAFGEVQVMDWGVAKVLREGPADPPEIDTLQDTPGSGELFWSTPPACDPSVAGTIVGTPAYMAPEQVRGEAHDERTDVFGLGAILCEILTARPPLLRDASVRMPPDLHL